MDQPTKQAGLCVAQVGKELRPCPVGIKDHWKGVSRDVMGFRFDFSMTTSASVLSI